MLKNYFIIAWRNMARHRVYAAINVLGLALGMTVCILIFLWVKDEKSVDDFGPAGRDLYIVYESYRADGTTGGTYSTPMYFDKNMAIPYIEGMKSSVRGSGGSLFIRQDMSCPGDFPRRCRSEIRP